jgi:flavin reductase (DIM6/NTAB) family NADH-FMN oxidoreductase RutF
MIIDPLSIPTADLHQFILGSVSPRPIAFASTVSADGTVNLAPYSFFNAFSSNPPILVFSSNRRVEGNTTKDTLHNIRETGEVVINVVNYGIVRQMAIASVDYPPETNEFEKAGLTPVPSLKVRPPRVKESPVAMECKVTEIIPLGDQGGAGHLILCHVVSMFVDDAVMDERNRIVPDKIDLVGRMGRLYYVRASGPAVFTVQQPQKPLALGFDRLPAHILGSRVLSGNQLAALAGMVSLPSDDEVREFLAGRTDLREKISELGAGSEALRDYLHREAQQLIESGDASIAAKVLLSAEL